MITNKPQRFFEGIDSLVEKEGELFYKGRYYGRINQERSSHLPRYKGVLDVQEGRFVEEEILSLRKQLEEHKYLLISNRGPCPIQN